MGGSTRYRVDSEEWDESQGLRSNDVGGMRRLGEWSRCSLDAAVWWKWAGQQGNLEAGGWLETVPIPSN